MLQKNKDKQERKAKRKPVLRPCRFTKKTTYTRKKGRNRDEKFHDMVYFQFEPFKVDFYKADPNDPDPDEEKVVLYV
jgi:hypothetical protein